MGRLDAKEWFLEGISIDKPLGAMVCVGLYIFLDISEAQVAIGVVVGIQELSGSNCERRW
jgi:hypothetical protein